LQVRNDLPPVGQVHWCNSARHWRATYVIAGDGPPKLAKQFCLEKQGLTLYFLPPYGPELNRIERLWHKMEYTWIAPKYRDSQMLKNDVDEILHNF
jgi:hypothetical protein